MVQGAGGTPSISIHALREEGDDADYLAALIHIISIHALREEGDVQDAALFVPLDSISIHALREEGDRCATRRSCRLPIFLSTPSARRATWGARREVWRQYIFLSTPSARRATDTHVMLFPVHVISIHALREEGDRGQGFSGVVGGGFLSTPSARRATGGFGVGCRLQIISIHALREEGDWPARRGRRQIPISIHALREEGDAVRVLLPPARPISIHALREEGDSTAGSCPARWNDFYPRPPRGGRLSVSILPTSSS